MIRRRLAAALLLVAMFAAGTWVGYRYGTRPAESRLKTPIPIANVAPYEPLGLSPDQRQRIEAIFEATRPATGSMMDSIQERLRSHLDSIEASVRAVLDPRQRRMLDSLRDAGALLPGNVRMRRPF